jgi:membrane-bound lytic murein transglycosylase MltF
MKICKYTVLAVLLLFFQSGDLLGEHSKGPSQMASHFKKQYKDDLGGLLDRRYIRVLTTFNKTNFYVSGNKLYGFEYSLLRDYERFLNKGFTRKDLKTVLEFIPVSRDRLIPLLVDGFGDIAAAGLTITPERLKEVNFTNPYLRGIDEAIVINKDVRGIKSLEDLSGRSIFVRQSSSYYESLVSLNKELMKKRLPRVRIIEAEENLETEDILEMVNSGAIDITVADIHLS